MAAPTDPTAQEPFDQAAVARGVSLLRVVVSLVALTAGILALHRLGASTLPAPGLSPSTWMGWWSANEPVTATMSLLRVGVLGLGWYLLAVTALTLVAAWGRAAGNGAAVASRLLRAIAVRPLRDSVAAVVGVAMVSATSAPAAASELQVHDIHTPVAVHLVADASPSGHDDVSANGSPDASDVEVSDALRRLREGAGRFTEQGAGGRPAISEFPPSVTGEDDLVDAAGSADAEVDAAGAAAGAADPDGPAGADPDSPAAADEHHVVAGESFWSIARDVLEARGSPTDEVAVAAYWLVLIDANRDRLVVADEPDLILPGQRLLLPEVEVALIAEAGS